MRIAETAQCCTSYYMPLTSLQPAEALYALREARTRQGLMVSKPGAAKPDTS